jgi:hypothetical protein
MAAIASRWFRRKASQRRTGSGLRVARFTQRETVRSEMSKPSLSSSPWMRGAPHVGFSATMRKISSRTSELIGFRPTACRAREIQLQYNRKPVRCQRTTVSGVTRINDLFQPDQTLRSTSQNNLSTELNRGRGRFDAEPAVVAVGRGSRGGVLLGSERQKQPSRADVEGAQTSRDHSEERAAQVRLEVIDSAHAQSFGEAQHPERLTS